MSEGAQLIRARLRTPRAAAIAGIVFADRRNARRARLVVPAQELDGVEAAAGRRGDGRVPQILLIVKEITAMQEKAARGCKGCVWNNIGECGRGFCAFPRCVREGGKSDDTAQRQRPAARGQRDGARRSAAR